MEEIVVSAFPKRCRYARGLTSRLFLFQFQSQIIDKIGIGLFLKCWMVVLQGPQVLPAELRGLRKAEGRSPEGAGGPRLARGCPHEDHGSPRRARLQWFGTRIYESVSQAFSQSVRQPGRQAISLPAGRSDGH